MLSNVSLCHLQWPWICCYSGQGPQYCGASSLWGSHFAGTLYVQRSLSLHAWMNEWMNERTNELMQEWMNDWMNDWGGRTNEWHNAEKTGGHELKTSKQILSFKWSPPTDILSDFIFHSIWHIFWYSKVSGLYSDSLADALSGIFLTISWHIFWHSIWFSSLAFYLKFWPGIQRCIFSGIVFGSRELASSR